MKSRKPTPPSSPQPTRNVTQEEISDRARAIWRERGQPEGRDVEHWLEAERQLRGQSGQGGPPTGGSGELTDAEREADARLDGLVQRPRGS